MNNYRWAKGPALDRVVRSRKDEMHGARFRQADWRKKTSLFHREAETVTFFCVLVVQPTVNSPRKLCLFLNLETQMRRCQLRLREEGLPAELHPGFTEQDPAGGRLDFKRV